MKLQKRMVFLILSVLLVLTALTGCATKNAEESQTTAQTSDQSSNQPSDQPSAPPAPLYDENKQYTVKILYPWGQDNFDKIFSEEFKSKIPNITIELVEGAAQMTPLQELNANGIVPDLIWSSFGLEPLQELEMIEPLDDLVQAYSFDLTKLDPSAVSYSRNLDSEGRLLGLPIGGTTLTLWYNKEVFDKFGQPYPTDHMTWDDIYTLAAKMTREHDGVMYRGLELGNGFTAKEALIPLWQKGVSLSNAETGEVLVETEPAVRETFELLKKFFSIPNLYNTDPEARNKMQFYDNTVAMTVSYPGMMNWMSGGNAEVIKNIEAAPIPVWSGEDRAAFVAPHHWVINSFSKEKDAAFRVLQEYYSDWYLKAFARTGGTPASMDPDVLAEFGKETPMLQGKNIPAFFKYPKADPPQQISKWDVYVNAVLEGSIAKFAESEMNIPEFLRTVKEEAEIKIKEAKAMK